MIDSGANENYISPRLKGRLQQHCKMKLKPYQLNMADGNPMEYGGGRVQEEVRDVRLKISEHEGNDNPRSCTNQVRHYTWTSMATTTRTSYRLATTNPDLSALQSRKEEEEETINLERTANKGNLGST